MTSILKIDTNLVLNDVYTYYGYEAKDVLEVKGGTVGYTYSIDQKYFLKIYDTELVVTKRCTEKLLEQLTVLHILQNKSLLTDKICYPIKNIFGQYFYAHDNVIGVLFNFIDGSAIGYENEYSNDCVVQLAEIVKTLHQVPIQEFYNLCPKEQFNLDFCNELKFIMENELTKLPMHFYHISKEYKDVVIEKIVEVKDLAEKLKQMNLPLVLCHTDIHGGNIMYNSQGKLFLVDWENVILAPKEADLFSFSEKTYFHNFSDNVNKTALLYYTIRRDLEDIWEFLNSVIHEEYDTSEQTQVLGHVKRIFKHLSCTKSL